MNTKKIAITLALVCTAAWACGCTSPSKVPFSNYWNENALAPHEELHETLVYDVTFEKGASYGYELDYQNGKFTTTLDSAVDEKGNSIYVYTSELTIDVIYTFQNESKTFTDHVTTEVKFLPANQGLTPISSKKSIVSSSPVMTNPIVIEGCYMQYDYTIDTSYDGMNGKTVVTQKTEQGDKTDEQTFTMEENGHSYLDNEQLLLSLRALPMSVNSAKLLAYSPFAKKAQQIAVACEATTEQDFTFYKNGSAETVISKIAYRPIKYQLDEKNPGFAQLAWIAVPTDSASNTNRNVMLRLETPIYQGMGTLVYQLSSVNYQ